MISHLPFVFSKSKAKKVFFTQARLFVVAFRFLFGCTVFDVPKVYNCRAHRYFLYLSSSFLQPDGCPDLCNGNGRCTLGQNSWQCVCQTGWRGPGCNVAMETSCADNKDNEGGEQKPFNSQSLKNRGLWAVSPWVILLEKGPHTHTIVKCCYIFFETNEMEKVYKSCGENDVTWKTSF